MNYRKKKIFFILVPVPQNVQYHAYYTVTMTTKYHIKI